MIFSLADGPSQNGLERTESANDFHMYRTHDTMYPQDVNCKSLTGHSRVDNATRMTVSTRWAKGKFRDPCYRLAADI